MKKILFSFLGIPAALIMMLIFGIASGVATVIETVRNIDAAWAYVYGATWFAVLQLLIVINLTYNIYKYKLYLPKKLPGFLFHVSFIVIFIGSALTRYVGFEGSMHIRENSQTNLISSREIYIQLIAKNDNGETISKDISKYIPLKGMKPFDFSLNLGDKTATLKYEKFILNGGMQWVEKKGGEPIIEIFFSDEKNKRTVLLRDKEKIEIGDLDITFNKEPEQKNYIKIFLKEDGNFYMNTNQNINYIDMAEQSKGEVEKNVDINLQNQKLYSIDGINFAFKTKLKEAQKSIAPLPKTEMGSNALMGTLEYNGAKEDIYVFFGDIPRTFEVGGKEFQVAWSPKMIELPFALYLKDFNMDRYPGSNSPSGYNSEVVVKDGNFSMDYNIYMNHVLDYHGFRFFQSSYDRDEQGTILSVNNDPGKIPTYIGYFLLMLGMFLTLFNPNSRFIELSKLIDNSTKRSNAKSGKKMATMLFAVLFLSFNANSLKADEIPPISKEHAKNLQSLVIQGFDGRMEPFDTVANEVLQKIYRKDHYEGMSATEVMLSIMVNPSKWRDVPLIRVSDKELKKVIGIPQNEKYAKFVDFYGVNDKNKSFYKLGLAAEEVNRKQPSTRTKFDKDVVKVDERLNIFYLAYITEIFKILPKQNDVKHTWYSPYSAMRAFSGKELQDTTKLLEEYFDSVIDAQKTGDWSRADKSLQDIKDYQVKVGGKVIPSANKIKFEILFNKANFFKRLTPIYLLAGLALLVFVFIRLMRPKVNMNFAFKSVYTINILAFILHTIGLGIRWYISGHAPWSNTYESLVYIAWSLSLSGIIFSRTSAISLSLTSILAGVTLFVAHLSSIDPQITTLQPVLNSYWLTIHVSVITASYGFLGLGALLGMFTLILMLFKKSNNNDELSKNIAEACRINEMSLILGLFLLTAGTFLGGVWANESWGRYWGWDPKETWSLVTILIYSAVVHMRLVPMLNSQYWFGVATMFSYSSVIMTYFGVNFYLSGMHSYASGDSVPVPDVVWISALVMIALSTLAFFKRKYCNKL